MHRRNRQRGATLIEVIGAFVLLAIIMGGIIDISHSAVMNAVYAKSESTAMALAQQKMGAEIERIRLKGFLSTVENIRIDGKDYEISYRLEQLDNTLPIKVPLCATCKYQVRVESIVYDYKYDKSEAAFDNKKALRLIVVVSW